MPPPIITVSPVVSAFLCGTDNLTGRDNYGESPEVSHVGMQHLTPIPCDSHSILVQQDIVNSSVGLTIFEFDILASGRHMNYRRVRVRWES